MDIQSFDLKSSYFLYKKDLDEAVRRVFDSGYYILGNEVKHFEKEFADYIGVSFGIGVATGSDGLILALMAAGLKEGDEVITVSHTAVATVASIYEARLTPVLIDIDPETMNMNPALLEKALSERTRAIVPVHLYGNPAEMDKIMEFARNNNLLVIEDCCQAHGASFKGKRVGSFGDMSVFSFYPTKNLGAFGDGGMVLTNKEQYSESLKLLRQYGWKKRYISEIHGLNSRLDELQAAVLRVKLRHLDYENERRKTCARIYRNLLQYFPVTLPIVQKEAVAVFHQFVIRLKERNLLMEYLKSNGIETLIHYPVPVHLQPAYKKVVRCPGSLQISELVANEVLSIPITPYLSNPQVFKVADTIKKWCKEQR